MSSDKPTASKMDKEEEQKDGTLQIQTDVNEPYEE
jgi:hypothetical protein